jgi:hypothetical protein
MVMYFELQAEIGGSISSLPRTTKETGDSSHDFSYCSYKSYTFLYLRAPSFTELIFSYTNSAKEE